MHSTNYHDDYLKKERLTEIFWNSSQQVNIVALWRLKNITLLISYMSITRKILFILGIIISIRQIMKIFLSRLHIFCEINVWNIG